MKPVGCGKALLLGLASALALALLALITGDNSLKALLGLPKSKGGTSSGFLSGSDGPFYLVVGGMAIFGIGLVGYLVYTTRRYPNGKPRWHDNPDKPGTQRYWDGSSWR